MTLRLSTLFETHIKTIIYDWKSAKRRGKISATQRKKPLLKIQNSMRNPSSINESGIEPSSSRRFTDSTESDHGQNHNLTQRTRNSQDMREPAVSRAPLDQPGPSHRRHNQTKKKKTRNLKHYATDKGSFSSSDSDNNPIVSPKRKLRQSVRQKKTQNPLDSGDTFEPYVSNKTPKKIKRCVRKSKSGSTNYKQNLIKKTELMKKTSSDEQSDANDDDESVGTSMAEGDGSTITSENYFSSENSTDDDDDDDKPKKRTLRKLNINDKNYVNIKNESEGQKNRRRKKYESDHSFHMDPPSSRSRQIVRSDSDAEVVRPTRGNTRRALQAWIQQADSIEESRENEEPLSRLRTRRRVEPSESENSPEETSISKRSSSNRLTRSSRHQQQEREESPLASTGRLSRSRAHGNMKF